MAEERTEAATPKRRAEARKRGQSARSHDLTTAAVLLAGIYGLKLLAAEAAGRMRDLLVGNLIAVGRFDKDGPLTAGGNAMSLLVSVLPPLLGLMAVTAVLVSVVQGGFVFAPGLLSPKFERVNPFSGAKRIFSMQGLQSSGKTLAKFAVVAAAVGWVIDDNMGKLSAIGALDLLPAVNVVAGLVWDVLFKAAIAMLALGAMDYMLERRRFLNSIRMTRQEVREEYRQSEGDPQVRAQIRRRREAMFREML